MDLAGRNHVGVPFAEMNNLVINMQIHIPDSILYLCTIFRYLWGLLLTMTSTAVS